MGQKCPEKKQGNLLEIVLHWLLRAAGLELRMAGINMNASTRHTTNPTKNRLAQTQNRADRLARSARSKASGTSWPSFMVIAHQETLLF